MSLSNTYGDIEISLLPIFEDNYVFIGRKTNSNKVFAVDPGESEKLLDYLEKRNLVLDAILITHEHYDHVDGVTKLLRKHKNIHVYAFEKIFSFFKKIENSHPCRNSSESIVGIDFQVMHLPGHTNSHLAFNIKSKSLLFSGDIIFGFGCGKIVDGTYEDQYRSLMQLRGLPSETKVFCTHEYTMRNLQFIKDEKKKFPASFLKNHPYSEQQLELMKNYLVNRINSENTTVPLDLENEIAFNPYLNCESFEEFLVIRKLKDVY